MTVDDLHCTRLPLLDDHPCDELLVPVHIPEDTPENGNSSPPWQLSLPHVCVAAIGAGLFGYHTGVVNAPLRFIAEDLGFDGNALAQGWIVSSCLLGAFIGCAFSGTIVDELGRRRSSQLSAFPVIVGGCFSAVAPNLVTMISGRFLVGLGLGVGAPATALYVSEVSPTAVRGTFGALCQIAYCIGILGALVVGLPVATIPGWWRVCFWISAIPAALLILGMEFCSESPRWLFKKSRWHEAENSIRRLWGKAHVKSAIADLVRREKSTEIEQATYKELFSKRYFKVVLIGAAVFAFQQLSGISVVFYFSSTVFRNAGITSDLVASVSVGIVNLSASCVAAYFMDRHGRKTLLTWSFFGMSLGMAMQASGAAFPVLARAKGLLSLCGTLLYVVMFCLGVGPVPALLLPEIFPNRIRAKAMAVCMCVHWIANCFVGLMFLQLLQQFGPPRVYTFFTVVCVLGVFFVREFVLETKGKSLEEIETLLLNEVQNFKSSASSLEHS